MIHLPPSFSCEECDKKFVHVGNFKNHKKRHQGILNEICKFCNKGFSTNVGLSKHIIGNHFAKFQCEETGCSTILSSKANYKTHLKTVHDKDDQVLIGKLLEKVEKLKPD